MSESRFFLISRPLSIFCNVARSAFHLSGVSCSDAHVIISLLLRCRITSPIEFCDLIIKTSIIIYSLAELPVTIDTIVTGCDNSIIFCELVEPIVYWIQKSFIILR